MEPLDLHVSCICYPLLEKLPKDLLPESFSTCSKAKKMSTKNRNIIGSLFEHPQKKRRSNFTSEKQPDFPGVEPLTLGKRWALKMPREYFQGSEHLGKGGLIRIGSPSSFFLKHSTCSPNHFFLTNQRNPAETNLNSRYLIQTSSNHFSSISENVSRI